MSCFWMLFFVPSFLNIALVSLERFKIKTMSAIRNIQKIICSLSENEINIARCYLKAFDSRGEKHENKTLKMFDLLLHNSYSEHQLQELIYGRISPVAYAKQVFRLRDKLLESLCLPVNVQRKEAYSLHTNAKNQIYLRTMQGQLLVERGFFEIAELILIAADELALKYEFFNERITILEHLAVMAKMQQRTSDCQRIAKKVNRTLDKLTYYQLCIKLLDLSLFQPVENTAEKLKDLLNLADRYNVQKAEYILVEIQACIAEKQNNLVSAITRRKRQVNLIDRNPGLWHGLEKPSTLAKLARLYLNHFDFSKASQTAAVALDLLPVYHPDFRSVLDCQIKAMCFLNLTLQTFSALQLAAKYFSDEKITYLLAAARFLEQAYEKVIELLEELNWRKADALGCGTPARILLQMAIIEQGLKEGNLRITRKLISLDNQMPLAANLNSREQLIVDLMQGLIIEKVNFKAVYIRFQQHIEQLRDKAGQSRWTPETGEIIVFPEWFMGRVLNVGYQVNFSKS